MTSVPLSGITILGATGSIGVNTLDVISQHEDKFKVVALSANRNVEKLLDQCKRFKPLYAVMNDKACAKQLSDLMIAKGLATQVLSGQEGLGFIAALPEVSKVMCAIVGAAGLHSTLKAVQAGKEVMIANKEPLVMAGDLLIKEANLFGATLLPVDSEHNALFQCMPPSRAGNRAKGVHKLILTASGGPFLDYDAQDLDFVTPQQACQHPNWSMGKKITVDCATLMNKGLEVIEACKLFGFMGHEIEVVIHPQSIIHSLVEFIDGSVLAQLGVPDMRVPIANCLAWPHRITSGTNRLSLTQIAKFTFLAPDKAKFPCLRLAYEALALKNAAPCVLNASNEVAVEAFLNGQIRFTDIATLNETVMRHYAHLSSDTLQEILQADKLAREYCMQLLKTCEPLANV